MSDVGATLTWLEEERSGRALGQRAYFFASCASTQREVHRLAHEGAPHGTVVVAARQTAGKGRAGRAWLSGEGGLYLSLLLRPQIAADKLPRLTSLAGAGVVDALQQAGADVFAKWPNDVLIPAVSPAEREGPLGAFRKVGGILTEGVLGTNGIEGAALGIGLNLTRPVGGFPDEISSLAGALSDQGLSLSSGEALRTLLDGLEARLADPNDDDSFALALAVLRERSCTLGRRVEVQGDDVSGVAEALADDGALLVRKDDGRLVRVVAGDVWPRG